MYYICIHIYIYIYIYTQANYSIYTSRNLTNKHVLHKYSTYQTLFFAETSVSVRRRGVHAKVRMANVQVSSASNGGVFWM